MQPYRLATTLIGTALLSGCAASPPTIGTGPAPMVASGLERVLGKDARALEALFGQADLDVREEGARKLQYASAVCILDTYLYPPAPGREALVTYVDARAPSGEDIDRASCVAALSRRPQAR